MKPIKCYDKYKVLFTISIVLVSTEFIHLKVNKALLVLSSARNVRKKKGIFKIAKHFDDPSLQTKTRFKITKTTACKN